MPLRDHFRSPVDDFASWEGFHAFWPSMIVFQLDEILPERYNAEPRVHRGSGRIIDSPSIVQSGKSREALAKDKDDIAIHSWTVSEPTLTVEASFDEEDIFEVRVFDNHPERTLVAAIEIVSPANKDRPEHRGAFVAKCASLLHHGVSVCIIDLVTVRHFNLYADLLATVDQQDPTFGDDPPTIYAVACRPIQRGKKRMFEAWSHLLTVGEALPTLPLWLDRDLAVPLDLEASYEHAYRELRLP
jgi:hypothetical protein